MDERLQINVIALFVWIMAQPISYFHPLEAIVGKQLGGIKAGPAIMVRYDRVQY